MTSMTSAPHALRQSVDCTSPTASGGGRPSESTEADTLEDDDANDHIEDADGPFRKFIQWPSSPYRMLWDLIGAVLIFYDLFAIPLSAFPKEQTTFDNFMDMFTLIFWTLNIFASFCVGFTKDGKTIMIPKKIALNYLKTWFVIDMLVVVPDWVFTIVAIGENGDKEGNGAGDSVRLLRVLRLVRMTRLLRLAKLRKMAESINDMIDSEYLSIVKNIIVMMMLLIVINHVIACVWYTIGFSTRNPNKPGNTWIESFGFAEDPWPDQYFASFHWTLTQFTPSSMHVQPINVIERIFAIVLVVCALVMFAYVVGSITGSLTQLRAMQENAAKQFWSLRRYLKQNKVPLILRNRIQRYAEHAWVHQQQKDVSTLQKNMPIFALLSDQLISELQCELTVPNLKLHPLLERMAQVCPVSMQRLSKDAIKHRQLARKDRLFIPQENATHMYIVVIGHLQYLRVDSYGEAHTELVQNKEDWISEPVLWCPGWLHLGGCVAHVECELLLVIPGKFAEVVALNPVSYYLACTYAKNFCKWMNEVDHDERSDIWQGDLIIDRHIDFMEIDDGDGQPALKALIGSKSALGLGRIFRKSKTAISDMVIASEGNGRSLTKD